MTDQNPEEKDTTKGAKKTDAPVKLSAEDRERQRKQDKLIDLQLDEAIDIAEKRKTKADSRKRTSESFQRELRETSAQEKGRAASCKHRKGGKVTQQKGKTALLHGNDANYSLITHTLTTGEKIVVCQRCPRVWEKPPLTLRKKDAAAYKKQLDDYNWALQAPTDNEASGTHLFLIEREQAA